MKKLFIGLLFVVLFPVFVCASPFLVCDLPQTGFVPAHTIVEITTYATATPVVTEVSGLTTAGTTEFQLLDLAGKPNGKYKFRAKWADAGNWWSDWSLPLTVMKTDAPWNLRVPGTTTVPAR
jgi:hypothetical protein